MRYWLQGTKLVMDNSEELINEGNEIMHDLILALSNEKLKRHYFFKNLKKKMKVLMICLCRITINANMDFTYYRKLKNIR